MKPAQLNLMTLGEKIYGKAAIKEMTSDLRALKSKHKAGESLEITLVSKLLALAYKERAQ